MGRSLSRDYDRYSDPQIIALMEARLSASTRFTRPRPPRLNADLLGMFIAEKRVAAAVLGGGAASAFLARFTDLAPLVGGTALLHGYLILV